MAKSILVGLAVLTLATSAALAATDKTTHHRHAVKPSAAAPVAAAPVAPAPIAAAPASPVMGAFPGFGVSAADHDLYIKNQQDSGLASGR
jgi:hypothetical protein